MKLVRTLYEYLIEQFGDSWLIPQNKPLFLRVESDYSDWLDKIATDLNLSFDDIVNTIAELEAVELIFLNSSDSGDYIHYVEIKQIYSASKTIPISETMTIKEILNMVPNIHLRLKRQIVQNIKDQISSYFKPYLKEIEDSNINLEYQECYRLSFLRDPDNLDFYAKEYEKDIKSESRIYKNNSLKFIKDDCLNKPLRELIYFHIIGATNQIHNLLDKQKYGIYEDLSIDLEILESVMDKIKCKTDYDICLAENKIIYILKFLHMLMEPYNETIDNIIELDLDMDIDGRTFRELCIYTTNMIYIHFDEDEDGKEYLIIHRDPLSERK